jgi:transcriptional regulator with GAF, ATPase, and Fis domain
VFELGNTAVLVGRDVDSSGLKVKDPQMSRLHFRLVRDPRLQVYRLGDAGSTNGTFVNGQLSTMAVLEPSSVVRAGDSLFVYEESNITEELHRKAIEAGSSTLGVLLHGETGTGKEWLARRIHAASGRKGRFVAVNCATLPSELASSELFGHARGAFSGAERDRSGLFLAADGGTLFLDEIADLPLHLQPMLLRVLEDKIVRAVGSDREVNVDVRIIAACQIDLGKAATEGAFRPDLYARLAQVVLELPPLRERRTELVPLIRSLSTELGFGADATPDAIEALLLWHWPYNVRELRTLLQIAAELTRGKTVIDLDFLVRHRPDIAGAIHDRDPAAPAGDEVQSSAVTGAKAPVDREQLRQAMRKHQGNISAVAAELGRPRAQIYRWLSALGISLDGFRATGSQQKDPKK